MSTEANEKVERVFAAALRLGSPRERAAHVAAACGDDARLRARVEALLEAHARAGDFLASPAVAVAEQPAASRPGEGPGEGPGDMIGPYKLLQLIGEGGFGAVYMVEQQEPVRRRVALKIIKLGMDTKQVVARFEAERQALAMLDHPNIAKVLDAGATETGRPYFVMELVKGIALGEYCDRANLSTRDRLVLFIDVCRAVHHAHQKGIIHRDLKPSNVLVTLHDGVPVPKVIDFGIARATNRRLTELTLFTEYGQFIGTPAYMSPEQAEMSGLDIDTRSDIYSLGVILYELLTGTTPLDAETLRAAGYGGMQRVIREEEPPTPSERLTTLGDELAVVARHQRAEPGALARLLRGDLDWIVMKALDKDRTRRYESASELVADIRRYLDLEPVTAGPPGVLYKLGKFVRRHRVGVLAGSVVCLAIVGGLALATAGFVEARREAERSQTIADFLQDLLVSTNPTEARARDMDVDSIVATAREVFGGDHATVAATLESRALQLQSAGRFDEAESLFRESLRIWEENYGEENVRFAITLGYLGRCLELGGDHRGAEKAFRRSIRLTANLPERQGVHISETKLALAGLLMNRGEYGEAERLLRESLTALETHSPDQHFQIALTANLLTNVLMLESKDAETLVAARHCLKAWRRALPGGGTTIGRVASQLGYYLHTRGHSAEAEPLLREAMEIFRKSDDPPIGERHIALRGLFALMMARKDESEEFVRVGHEYVASARDRVGATAVPYLELLAIFAGRLVEMGRPVEALPLGLEATRTLQQTGASECLLAECIDGLEPLAWEIARTPDLTADVYESALAGAEIVRIEDPDAVGVLGTIALLAHRLGRADDARDALDRLTFLAEGPDYAGDEEVQERLADVRARIRGEPAPPPRHRTED